MIAAPLPDTHNDWVLATPFRAQLCHLQAASGLPWDVIALAAGVSPGLVQSLVFGRRGRQVRRISPTDAAKLLALDARALAGLRERRVPAGPSIAKLERLLALGCDLHQVAGWCRTTPARLRALRRSAWCSELTALLLEAVCIACERHSPGIVPAPAAA